MKRDCVQIDAALNVPVKRNRPKHKGKYRNRGMCRGKLNRPGVAEVVVAPLLSEESTEVAEVEVAPLLFEESTEVLVPQKSQVADLAFVRQGLYCTCGYGVSLPPHGRCEGCGWRWGKEARGAIVRHIFVPAE